MTSDKYNSKCDSIKTNTPIHGFRQQAVNATMVNDALSIRQVAEYFRVSTRTIREWVKRDGSFPVPFRKFGTLRFRRLEIEEYWASNTRANRQLSFYKSKLE